MEVDDFSKIYQIVILPILDPYLVFRGPIANQNIFHDHIKDNHFLTYLSFDAVIDFNTTKDEFHYSFSLKFSKEESSSPVAGEGKVHGNMLQ